MANRRVSLKDRKAQDGAKGVDAFFAAPSDVPEAEEKKETTSGALEKVSLYIRPDQVTSVERIQLNERERTGKKPTKSDLTIEAFDLLIQKYSKPAKQ